MQQKYSGKKSKKFWKKVNKLPDIYQNELYSLGVALQNLEGFVLKRLNNVKRLTYGTRNKKNGCN